MTDIIEELEYKNELLSKIVDFRYNFTDEEIKYLLKEYTVDYTLFNNLKNKKSVPYTVVIEMNGRYFMLNLYKDIKSNNINSQKHFTEVELRTKAITRGKETVTITDWFCKE